MKAWKKPSIREHKENSSRMTDSASDERKLIFNKQQKMYLWYSTLANERKNFPVIFFLLLCRVTRKNLLIIIKWRCKRVLRRKNNARTCYENCDNGTLLETIELSTPRNIWVGWLTSSSAAECVSRPVKDSCEFQNRKRRRDVVISLPPPIRKECWCWLGHKSEFYVTFPYMHTSKQQFRDVILDPSTSYLNESFIRLKAHAWVYEFRFID